MILLIIGVGPQFQLDELTEAGIAEEMLVRLGATAEQADRQRARAHDELSGVDAGKQMTG